MSDRLTWWEEVPLGLALLAQSYVVGLWYFASISGADTRLDLIVAIGAGLALDLIVVTTVMGRRAGRSSGWSWATSFGAFGCSALIALDRYGWEARSLLHVAFPLVVFLYSQHLAIPRRSALDVLPDRLGTVIAIDRVSLPAEIAPSAPVAPALASDAPALKVVESSRYPCPHCRAPLASKQALGAATKNGYCLGCKAEQKAAA